ncbi:MAG: 7TM domain-containing protein [bacterium]
MKKLILILLFTSFLAGPVLSQENIDDIEKIEKKEVEELVLTPKIKAEEFVEINKKAIFDASNSTLSPTSTPIYNWEFGDGGHATGKDVVHEYKKIGKYTVKLSITQNNETQSVEQQIFAYDRKALLIIDEKTEQEISQIKLQAAENGLALQLLSTVKDEGGFLTEDKLVEQINKIGNYVKDADILIFYTRSSLGLQSFTRFWQNIDEKDKDIIRKKFLVAINDGNMDVATNFAYQSFKIIGPKYILLTRQEALSPLFTIKDKAEAVTTLKKRGIEYKIIDETGKKSQIFVLSSLITHFISKGVTSNSVYLIMIIPFLACIVVFFRQIIGLSTFGIYTPVITTASFYILGLWFGLITFLFAVIVGYLMKYLLNKIELLYLSKVALNLGLISLSFLLVIWLILASGTSVNLSVAIFPILVMSSVVEKFMAAQSEGGFRGALFGVLETLIVVVISYYLIIWTLFNNIVMSWPELVLIPLIFILLIGKFSGLRLSEYLRFRSLFAEHIEE